MKRYEKIKNDIASCDSALETAGYLAGIQFAAIIYCSRTCPDEVSNSKSRGTEVSLYGMQCYLESEVPENLLDCRDSFM